MSSRRTLTGQSLVEVIVALAIFSLVASALATMAIGGNNALLQGGDQSEAAALAEEGIEAIRAIRDAAWNVSPDAQVSAGGGSWAYAGGGPEVIGKYTRTIAFTDVCRDGSDDITPCPGTYVDAHTRRASVTVSWTTVTGAMNTVERVAYLTNWDSRDWTQTNWAGGGGQSVWSDTTRGDTVDPSVETGVNGQLSLAQGSGSWEPSAGQSMGDTSDTDFGLGTVSSTAVSGTGVGASLTLGQSLSWAPHADSQSVTTENLFDTAAISTSDAWAVGASGKIVRYTGANWSEYTDVGATQLNGVAFASATNGWSVGNGGARYAFNGTTWASDAGTSVTHTTDADFAGTYSNTQVSGSGTAASVVLTSTTSWSSVVSPTAQTVYATSFVSASDGWAAAGSGIILRWNGTVWSEFVDTGTTTWRAINMVSASDGWIVGTGGAIRRWDGVSWNSVTSPTTQNLLALDMVTGSDGWAAGASGTILRWNGATWSEFVDTGNQSWNGLAMVTSSDGWLVGSAGEIRRWNGASWSLFLDTGNETRNAIAMVNASDGWFVGNSGEIRRWNGVSWSSVLSPVSENLLSLSILSSDNVWAGGRSGKILYWDGLSWAETIDTGNMDWETITVVSSNDGWVAGQGGAVYRYEDAYSGSGTFTSTVFDSGLPEMNWQTLSWGETIPSGADVTVATRTGPTPTPDGSWTAFSAELTNPAGSTVLSAAGRYLQYRATLTRGVNASETPALNTLTIAYGAVPTTENLHAVTMVSGTDAWAVGANGIILRWNGMLWTLHTDVGTSNLYGVAFVSANDGWAVGDGGKVYRFNGTIWSEFIDTGNDTWNDISMISASDGWMGENKGQLWRWNGTSWALHTDTGGEDWYAITAVNVSDVWAASSTGEIYHFDGSSWTLSLDVGTQSWHALSFVSASEGWLVGDGGTIYRYAQFYTSTGTFTSRVFDGTLVGTVWNTAYWTETLPAGADVTIATRSGPTPTPDGSWSAFSTELTNATASLILSPANRYLQYRATLTRGSSPTQTPSLDDITLVYNSPTIESLEGVSIVSVTDAWAVGRTGDIVRWNGSAWSAAASPTVEDLFDISLLNATDGWAVGASGKILRWNGSTWSEFVDVGAEQLNAVSMRSSSDGWAVGESGGIYQWDGVAWGSVASPVGSRLRDVLAVSASDAWAFGTSGKILRWDGVSWSEFVDTGNDDWYDGFAVSASDAWLVGNSGAIWHWDGVSWTLSVDTGSETWSGVWLQSANDGWVVGSGGAIRKWDGASWISATSPTTQTLNAIMLRTAADGFAVGASGAIIRLTGGAYAASGTAVSSAFSMGDASPLGVVEWDETIPACSPACTVRFQLSTAPDSGGSPGVFGAWVGPDGTAGTYFTTATGTLIPAVLNGNQWVRYKVFLDGDTVSTPVLQEVRVNYK